VQIYRFYAEPVDYSRVEGVLIPERIRRKRYYERFRLVFLISHVGTILART